MTKKLRNLRAGICWSKKLPNLEVTDFQIIAEKEFDLLLSLLNLTYRLGNKFIYISYISFQSVR